MADATCKTCKHFVANALDATTGRCRTIGAGKDPAPAKIMAAGVIIALMVDETFGCVLHEVNQ